MLLNSRQLLLGGHRKLSAHVKAFHLSFIGLVPLDVHG